VIGFVFLVPLVAMGLCVLLHAVFGEHCSARWWLMRLGVAPVILFLIAAYILTFPTPVPDNYDPRIHGNPGRLDFMATLVWGVVLPVVYLLLATPVSIGWAIWRRHRNKKRPD
jgi:hypothetical protein